jgi:hypothetical protein
MVVVVGGNLTNLVHGDKIGTRFCELYAMKGAEEQRSIIPILRAYIWMMEEP